MLACVLLRRIDVSVATLADAGRERSMPPQSSIAPHGCTCHVCNSEASPKPLASMSEKDGNATASMWGRCRPHLRAFAYAAAHAGYQRRRAVGLAIHRNSRAVTLCCGR